MQFQYFACTGLGVLCLHIISWKMFLSLAGEAPGKYHSCWCKIVEGKFTLLLCFLLILLLWSTFVVLVAWSRASLYSGMSLCFTWHVLRVEILHCCVTNVRTIFEIIVATY
jgi:hypothetical protein